MAPWQQVVPVLVLPLLFIVGYLTRVLPTSLSYPTSPLRFKVKRRNDREAKKGAKTELINIREFLETYVPSLYAPYSPTWWLLNGHLQTAYVVMADFSKVDKVTYERTLIRVPDGGTLGLDFTPTKQQAPDLPDDTPIVVVQHGLTGGSYESYVRSILASACKPKSEGGLGFRGVVINFRGCELPNCTFIRAALNDSQTGANVEVTSPQVRPIDHHLEVGQLTRLSIVLLCCTDRRSSMWLPISFGQVS